MVSGEASADEEPREDALRRGDLALAPAGIAIVVAGNLLVILAAVAGAAVRAVAA
jgi:hypothetical protein